MLLVLTVPLALTVPAPTRGEGQNQAIKAEVVYRSGNKSKITWHGLKSNPAAREDLTSSVMIYDVPGSGESIQPEEVIAKFAADLGIDRSKLVKNPHLKASGEVIKTTDYSFGTVIEINTTLAGWRPGNTTIFLLSKDKTKVVKIDPAWHLRFSWDQAVVKW